MQSTEPITQLIKSTFGGNAFEKIVTPLAGLIFLRWADQFETELEAIAAFDEADFEPTLPQGLRWRSWCELQGNRLRAFLSERLIPALGGGLPGTFGYRVEKVKPALEHLAGQPEEVQNTLMEWVRQLKLETAEDRRAAGLAFDDILDVGLSRPKDLPHLSTPQVLAELMVELAEPKPGDRIYDPCFGLGNLLVQAARRLHGRGVQGAPRAWKEIRDNSIYGVENNPSAYVVAMTRLVLAGIENPGLQVGDALTRPTGQNRAAEGFDCVLANPPMGTQLNLQGANHFPINARWSESLFLQHVMGALRPGGRAVIVLPERTLFSTGPERRIREMLLKEYRVEGVIALDERAFPHSRLKQNLLVFRKELPADKVRFYTVGRLAPASGTVRQLSLFDAAEPSALYQVRHRRGETNREGRALHDRPLSPAENICGTLRLRI